MNSISNLYIEPTTHCNLSCQMCSRNHWVDEEIGHMSMSTFEKIMSNIPDSIHRIFFGGVGEPLSHPEIIAMIKKAKETGRSVGMITNGTLLDDEMSQTLLKTGLNELWISMDSVHAEEVKALGESGESINVLDNVKSFINKIPNRYLLRYNTDLEECEKIKVGIAFVLMKSNLEQFRELVKMSQRIGIAEIKASHLIPYDDAGLAEICYGRIIGTGMYRESEESITHLNLPIMEGHFLSSEKGEEQLVTPNLSVSILDKPIYRRKNWCKFVEDGYVFVRWDGEVSPCMPLLHDSHVIQQGRYRHNKFCSYGNVNKSSIQEIWNASEYSEFRKRVKEFNFSPCVTCGPCDLFESNETDCEGNPFPTCGACLWAEGLFQCP